MTKPEPLTLEEAEVIALNALTFLASAPDRLTRFLHLTGLEPSDLHAAADSHAVKCAVLRHLMGNESELLVFAAEFRVQPTAVVSAYHRLDEGA